MTLWMALLQASAAESGMRATQSIWPFVLVIAALAIAAPLAFIFGKNRGRPGR
jgi:hypothetical protein